MDHYQEHDHLSIVSASHQLQGMGRMGRSWFGNDQSLMCSILLKDDIDTLNISLLPLVVAQSIHKVLTKYHPHITIKWPNDLMINDLKLAGILVKTKMMDQKVLAIIVGLGININQTCFDDALQVIATSLHLESGLTYDIFHLMREIFHQFTCDLLVLKNNQKQLIDYCNHFAYLNGHRVHFAFNHQRLSGIASHVNVDGKLVIHSDDALYEILSDEIVKSS